MNRLVVTALILSLSAFFVSCDSSSDSQENVNDAAVLDTQGEDLATLDALPDESGLPDGLEELTGEDAAADLGDDAVATDVHRDLVQDVPVETTIPFSCGNGTVVDGWNEGWTVAGKTRRFFADLPSNPGDKQVPVIFVYYGFGDSVNNFKLFFHPDPDADPEFPVAVIYPDSLDLQPIGGTDGGIEWAIFESNPGDDNIDVKFFEELLGCVNETMPVNPERIYAFGFSAGAIFTNLLQARYPEILPSVISMSGAWFNDEDTVAGVNTMGLASMDWAPITNAPGTVFMTHGGTSDTYGMMGITIINFETSAQYAIPFLTARGRTVIDCPHNSGHTNHPSLLPSFLLEFFKDHRGTESTYLDMGLPEWMPSACTIYPAE